MVAIDVQGQNDGAYISGRDLAGEDYRRGLTAVGDTAGKMGLVAAAGLGVIVAASANFESAMPSVAAATHESKQNMDLLREAALRAGAETVYSASEAAGAVESLAKAGVSTKDILEGGLDGALSLAAAGQLEVADAADIAATALTQFRLSGDLVQEASRLTQEQANTNAANSGAPNEPARTQI